jgi:hypothetical protein
MISQMRTNHNHQVGIGSAAVNTLIESNAPMASRPSMRPFVFVVDIIVLSHA